MSCFQNRPGPLAGLWACLDPKDAVHIQKGASFFFRTDLDPRVGSWSCLDLKEAVLKQK